jgi:uncharacterized protein (UPF0276 family)
MTEHTHTTNTCAINARNGIDTYLPHAVGVGFKPQHLSAIMQDSSGVDWLEIHAENYMIDGGPRKAMLEQLAMDFPISCHGVGLSIGAPQPLNTAHLKRLVKLLDWLQPAVFSEHLAWSTHGDIFYNDLLPMPYTKPVLDQVISHVHQVQDTLKRQILIENPSTYVSFSAHDMTETDFINAIIQHTGCGLLLDINNVFVSSRNQNRCSREYLAQLPMHAVGEIHLGGHSVDHDQDGHVLLIDSHNASVADAVWQLYKDVIATHGTRPTLIEWDNDVPAWHVLQRDAIKASLILDRIHDRTDHHEQHALA